MFVRSTPYRGAAECLPWPDFVCVYGKCGIGLFFTLASENPLHLMQLDCLVVQPIQFKVYQCLEWCHDPVSHCLLLERVIQALPPVHSGDFHKLSLHSRLPCSFLLGHYLSDVMPDNKLSSGAPNARLHLEMDLRLVLLWRLPNLSSFGCLVIMTIGERSANARSEDCDAWV